ncbi:MAG: hypothetical protein JKX76_01690, partial [Colwellia sp.]|nr:hypothetical protein [Colwellia sp.]
MAFHISRELDTINKSLESFTDGTGDLIAANIDSSETMTIFGDFTFISEGIAPGSVLSDVDGNGVVTWQIPSAGTFDPSTSYVWTSDQIFANDGGSTVDSTILIGNTGVTGGGGAKIKLISDSTSGTNKDNSIEFFVDSTTVEQFKLFNDTANNTMSLLANSTGTGFIMASDGSFTFAENVVMNSNLTINGTTTVINQVDLVVEDKDIILGNVTTPSVSTADGGGIILLASTDTSNDKNFLWVDATDSWTSNVNIDLASGKEFTIAGSTLTLDNINQGTGTRSYLDSAVSDQSIGGAKTFGSTVAVTGALTASSSLTASNAFTVTTGAVDLGNGSLKLLTDAAPTANQILSSVGTDGLVIWVDAPSGVENPLVIVDSAAGVESSITIGTAGSAGNATLNLVANNSTTYENFINFQRDGVSDYIIKHSLDNELSFSSVNKANVLVLADTGLVTTAADLTVLGTTTSLGTTAAGTNTTISMLSNDANTNEVVFNNGSGEQFRMSSGTTYFKLTESTSGSSFGMTMAVLTGNVDFSSNVTVGGTLGVTGTATMVNALATGTMGITGNTTVGG